MATRVCDRCYNDIGGVLTSPTMTNSVAGVDDSPQPETSSNDATRPERQREKRSYVVDDLAKRIKSSALTGAS